MFEWLLSILLQLQSTIFTCLVDCISWYPDYSHFFVSISWPWISLPLIQSTFYAYLVDCILYFRDYSHVSMHISLTLNSNFPYHSQFYLRNSLTAVQIFINTIIIHKTTNRRKSVRENPYPSLPWYMKLIPNFWNYADRISDYHSVKMQDFLKIKFCTKTAASISQRLQFPSFSLILLFLSYYRFL